jgi:hypothetical protein
MPDDDDLDESPTVTLKRSEIRQLEKRAKLADELEGRAATAERALAFAKAGIDLTDTKSNYFVKGYEGDLEPDAIKAAAIKDGFLPAPDVAPDNSGDADALGRMAEAAATGGDAPDGLDRLINAQSEDEFWEIAQQTGAVR